MSYPDSRNARPKAKSNAAACCTHLERGWDDATEFEMQALCNVGKQRACSRYYDVGTQVLPHTHTHTKQQAASRRGQPRTHTADTCMHAHTHAHMQARAASTAIHNDRRTPQPKTTKTTTTTTTEQ